MKRTLIYHYSKELYRDLLTPRRAGVSPDKIKAAVKQKKEYGLEGAYVDHISFFFDPIPSKTLASLFSPDHAVWFEGSKLIEYVVDVDQFEKDVLYRVVESKRKTAFMDKFVEENNWVEDNPKLLRKYLRELDILQREWGELASDLGLLKKQIREHSGKTEKFYKEASLRSDFEEGRKKYAANVPHLMIYPKSGRVRYLETNEVIIGSDARKPIYHRDPLTSFMW